MDLVFDIGGTSCKWKLFNNKKIVREDIYQYQKFINVNEIKEIVLNIYHENLKQYKINNIAISSMGIVDSITGKISGLAGIENYDQVNWKKIFSKQPVKVYIENDANCIALSELSINNKINNALVISVGTGIGGALIINHQLFKGSHLAAGEFGAGLSFYDKNKFYNISTQSSSYTICNNYQKLTKKQLSTKEIFVRYTKDNNARKVIDEMIFNLSKLIINSSLIIDPDYVFIGGTISTNKLFIKLLTNQVNKMIIDSNQPQSFKIAPVHNVGDANIYGALSLITK